MTGFDAVQDSGQRTQFSTGSQRDSQEGKGRFDLLPFYPLERLAQHFENGAKKYGDHNWKKGQPLSQYVNSGMRHALKTGEGWTDEDHPAAAVWNFMAFMWTKNEIDNGRLPAELDDIDWPAPTEAEPEPGPLENFFSEGLASIALRESLPKPTDFFSDELVPERVFRVGQKLKKTDYDTLPIGSKITWQGFHERDVVHLEKYDDGGWRVDPEARIYAETRYMVNGWRLVRLGPSAPEPAAGNRVSVRKITKALSSTIFHDFVNGRGYSWYHDHPEVVQILDALEDAGYEITYQKS